MIEQVWLAGKHPPEMLLAHLLRDGFANGKKGKRKMRLFACACCRRAGHLLPEGIIREAVQLVENMVDGRSQRNDLKTIRERIRTGVEMQEWPLTPGAAAAVKAICSLAAGRLVGVATRMSDALALPETGCRGDSYWVALKSESTQQVLLLREIFGNPFRPAVVTPSLLAWNDGLVRRLAETIYDERTFDRLPILADALEEAGCTDADILNHCRQPGEHVRGCWVVDLILGKS